jgi:hypothetical protein
MQTSWACAHHGMLLLVNYTRRVILLKLDVQPLPCRSSFSPRRVEKQTKHTRSLMTAQQRNNCTTCEIINYSNASFVCFLWGVCLLSAINKKASIAVIATCH